MTSKFHRRPCFVAHTIVFLHLPFHYTLFQVLNFRIASSELSIASVVLLYVRADFRRNFCYFELILKNFSGAHTNMSSLTVDGNDQASPLKGATIPSPLITRRTRTPSMSERALTSPELQGTIKTFCREKGHGFISPSAGGDDIFLHVSDIEGEYIPLPGDTVKFKLCPIPPKFEKCQAVHVHITNLTPEVHKKWEFS